MTRTVRQNQLLTTDWQGSILSACLARQPCPFAYPPYGFRHVERIDDSLLGFNGERQEPVIGHYLLGQGFRLYNPVLMRFNSPDNWSPFGEGGVNAYAYVLGDPVNQTDPSGHMGKGKKPKPQRSTSFEMRLAALGHGGRTPVPATDMNVRSSAKTKKGSAVSRQAESAEPTNKIVWEVNTNRQRDVRPLNRASQAKFDNFLAYVPEYGMYDAATMVGDTNLKLLQSDQWQIRLSQSERVTFRLLESTDPKTEVITKMVEIRDVGGHT
ncbi:RHS repeat-associated core domain-containing protein [Pseudomonas sp. GD03858]|uniref:RHS repeat-associated core domain-containing protein n=1 Tax=unclassified Pseudomonas TaxID=196821 RepID=UPI002448245D|nr:MULTISPECIES: RHS repeat-associated core domain-containing protein [unclassified Pseudomonas]MDH0647091.1 RHS repeat-associated core domain-containing protein [Pseudomonas sp. GD03867]MDH0662250.1 RHS repeat-associated core domain-containing protein [Pseudomonas sp. GD03858]